MLSSSCRKMSRWSAQGAKDRFSFMSWKDILSKRTLTTLKRLRKCRLSSSIKILFRVSAETSWNSSQAKLYEVKRTTKAMSCQMRLLSTWPSTELDAESARRTSVRSATLTLIIQVKPVIKTLRLAAGSAVKIWSSLPQVCFQHSRTYAGRKSALIWCRNLAISC